MADPTPGPWTAQNVDERPYVSGPDRNAPVICDLLPREWAPHEEFTAEDEANAHLIAAAPDLLAALEGLLDAEYIAAQGVIEFGPGGTMEEERAGALIEVRRDAARAAIAKARPTAPSGEEK